MHETNLIGDDATKVRTGKNVIAFHIGPFEVKAFRPARAGEE